MAGKSDVEELIALSFSATGFDRGAILADTFSFSQRICVLEQAGRIAAFGCLRPFGRGLHLGPLIAANIHQAAAIVHQLRQGLDSQFVRMDCPADDDLEPVLLESGLAQASEVVQMVRGVPPTPQKIRQYGLLTQALG